MDLPKRKHIRLKEYDYSQNGYYFVTICASARKHFFGTVNLLHHVGADIIRPSAVYEPNVELSRTGKLVETAIMQISEHYSSVTVDKYVIMPNHVHIIIVFDAPENGRIISAPTLSVVVGSMKRWVSKHAGFSVFQPSFYEHIIRNDDDYLEKWNYIDGNPSKWTEDKYFPY